MTKAKLLSTIIIIIIATIGVIGSGWLVLKEFQQAHTCPYLFGIPACIIILVCFLVPLVSHLLKRFDSIYFICTGLAFIIAAIASAMQLTGYGECPKTNDGTPMCYYSLLLFTSLIALKTAHRYFK